MLFIFVVFLLCSYDIFFDVVVCYVFDIVVGFILNLLLLILLL